MGYFDKKALLYFPDFFLKGQLFYHYFLVFIQTTMNAVMEMEVATTFASTQMEASSVDVRKDICLVMMVLHVQVG